MSLSPNCQVCHEPHGRAPQAKFCAKCARKAYYQFRDKKDRRTHSEAKDWDGPTYLGITPSEMDWARLAAYIDGEGSINLTPRVHSECHSATFSGKVVVTNTDFRLAKWCLETFGMRFYVKNQSWAKRREQNWRICYFSQASSFKAAWLLRNCIPWFLMKAEQAKVVLDHQRSTSPDTWERASGTRTPQDILEYRRSLKERLTELNRRGRQPDDFAKGA